MAALFIGYFAWFAVDLVVTSWRIDDMSTGVLVVPLWIPQIGYATGLVILFIAIVDELARVVRGLKPSYEKEPPRTAEEVIERAASSGV
jgi:TRAP-type C4-dicarboxylate transport system permease small subunit